MRTIDKSLIDAMRAYIAERCDGKRYVLAERIGVSAGTVSHYLNGNITSMRRDTWNALRPLVLPYMAAQADAIACSTESTTIPVRVEDPKARKELSVIARRVAEIINSMSPDRQMDVYDQVKDFTTGNLAINSLA